MRDTRAAGTARILGGARKGSPVGDEVSRIEGIADLPNRVARASVHHLTPEVQGEIQGKLNDEPVEDPEEEEARAGAQAFMKIFSMVQETAYVGGAIYTKVDDGWADFSCSARDDARSVEDPLWLVDALLGARDDVTEVGREEVRGVRTMRYHLTLDPRER